MATNNVGGPIHHSILDSIITGIFGPSTDEMTPEDAAKTEAARKHASNEAIQMADSARRAPGMEFMNPPTSGSSGGSDLIDTIGKIVKFFGG